MHFIVVRLLASEQHWITLIPQVHVLCLGPIFENSLYVEMQACISLLLHDVSIVLNLPIVNLFFKSHTLGYTMQKNGCGSHYVEN